MNNEMLYVAMFLVATAVAVAARRFRVPYTVALVVAGLLLGSTHVLSPPHLTRELLYAVFLPGLIFEAAFHLDVRRFWSNKLAILLLAVPGLVLSIALTALLVTPALAALAPSRGFGLMQGAVLAALLAATDPIAVVGLFKSLGAPRRLAILVEGESLVNDGTAVVVFTIVLAFAGGGPVSVSTVTVDFARIVLGGCLVGALAGYLSSKAIQRIDDPMIEITITSVAAYGSFALAERVHLSGVLATVAAGMICGNYGTRTGMSPATRVAVESFWVYVAFALNSVVFLLIGFEVRVSALAADWAPIALTFVAVLLGRGLTVALTALALGGTRERIERSWAAVLTWGGLRGGLSMVLALSLPDGFPYRSLLVTTTFGVVVVSILLQGLTMAPLLRRLGLVERDSRRSRHAEEKIRQRAAHAALSALESLDQESAASPAVRQTIRTEYERRLTESGARVAEMHLEDKALELEEEHALRRQLLLAEKDALLRGLRAGAIGPDAADAVLRELDAQLVALEDAVRLE